MKKKFYQFFLFALTAGMMLPACSSDEPQPEIVGPDGATAYAKVSITFPGSNRFGSRAFSSTDEFENGSNAESEIKSLLFVFYDGDGRAVGHTTLTSTTIPPIPTPAPRDQNANVQDVYSVEVPVNLAPGSKKPTQVMCYANPQNTTDQYANLSEVYKKTRATYKSADDGFTMNNSVYYDGSNNRVIATQIPTGGLKMEGETGNLAETNIYIERLAAKVSVNKASDFTIAPYEINNTTYLKFVPEWWSVTAVEQNTNLIKNLPAVFTNNSADVQKFIKGSYRTYWAHSSSYKDSFDPDNFPLTGWDIKAPLPTSTKDIKLKYLTYNDIIGLRPAAEGDNDRPSWGGEQYFLETTGRSERLSNTSINGKLAMPNAIIVGHYEVYSDKTMQTKIDKFNTADGFYRYASDLYTKNDIVAAMLSNHARYLRKAENTSLDETDINSIFSMMNVRKFYRNGVQTDAALHYVAPQATTESLIENLEYFDGTNWVKVTSTNINTFNDFIVKQTNCAISYKEGGKAFFTVLVEHYGKVTEGTSSKEIEGSYGLVRNHTYKITVGKIAGLASGINDVTDPLLPMADEYAKFKVSANLNVLGWHVCTQKVDL